MQRSASKEDVHAYQAIADELRGQIREGHYLPGAILPTEQQLRDTYGVSRSTVRRALATLAESGWAEVLPRRGVAARLGGKIDIGGSVAYIDYSDLVNERLFFGLSRALQEMGLHLVHVDCFRDGVEGAAEYAHRNGFVAAFVWSKTGFPDLDRLRAVQSHMPLIALDHRIGALQTDLISEDNLGGAYQVVRHLAKLGRTRIAVSGMMDMLEINHERFSGYLKGVFESGHAPHPVDFLFTVTSGGGPAETSLLARRMTDTDRPDAIFALQDMTVPTIVNQLAELGLRVPEDVAVAAFGGEFPIQIGQVGLTSMVVDWPAFIHECARVLELRLRLPREPFVHAVLPASLVVRGSCGAPVEFWDPLPTAGIETSPGQRWRVQGERLQMRADPAQRLTTTGT